MRQHILGTYLLLLTVLVSCSPDIVVRTPDGGTTTPTDLLENDVPIESDIAVPPSDTIDPEDDKDTTPVESDTVIACDETTPCPNTPCRVGVCQDRECVFQDLLDGAPCTPQDACLQPGTCNGGTCDAVPIDCNDSDDCTVDTCVDGACEYTTICCVGTGPCDDGDLATKDDTCNGEGLCVGTPIECPEPTACIPEYTKNGVDCEPQPANGATPCDDGDETTKDDTCDGNGQCKGSSVECPTPGVCISEYIFDGSDCVVVYDPSGTACDDGDATTNNDACSGDGACQGTPIECPTPSACTTSYTPDGDGCTPTHAPTGTACDDGDPGTTNDTCNGSGQCGGEAINCPAPSTCIDSYSPNGADCTPNYSQPGTACDDGDAATSNDVCDGAGVCAGSPFGCPGPTLCTPSYTPNGADCAPNHAPAGTQCNDGNAATKNDTCDGAGGCAGDPISCPAPTGCITSYTTDGSGCVPNYAPSGTSCDDGSTSTKNDVCNGAGLCQGTPYNCPATTSCISGYTQDGAGCVPTYVPGGTTCGTASSPCKVAGVCDGAGTCQAETNAFNGAPCGDSTSTICNAADSCQNGVCVSGFAPANTPCGVAPSACQNAPVCNGAGTCAPATQKPNGTSCGSTASSACDQPDTCVSGQCVSNFVSAGTPCGTSSGECKLGGTCNGSGTCNSETNKPNGTPCGNSAETACSAPDSCLNGVCQPNHAAPGTACGTASSPCKVAAVCDAAGACGAETNVANGTACGDQSNTPCSNPDSCMNGTCMPNHASSGTVCGSASNECKLPPTCDDVGVCGSEANKQNGTACGSASNTVCTNPDTCLNGACQANHEPAGTLCGTASNDCRNPETCNGSGTCLAETSKANGTPCGDTKSSDCSEPDTCEQGVCQENHLPDGTVCGPDSQDCTVATCAGGTCSGTGPADIGSLCIYSPADDTPLNVCGTCAGTTCTFDDALNTFCHMGVAGAPCNFTAVYACQPCGKGYSFCFLDVGEPLP